MSVKCPISVYASRGISRSIADFASNTLAPILCFICSSIGSHFLFIRIAHQYHSGLTAEEDIIRKPSQNVWSPSYCELGLAMLSHATFSHITRAHVTPINPHRTTYSCQSPLEKRKEQLSPVILCSPIKTGNRFFCLFTSFLHYC